MDRIKKIKNGALQVAVIGCGFIGFTTAVHMAKKGIKVIALDNDPKRVSLFNEGKTTVPGLDYWIGFDPSFLVSEGIMKATLNWDEILNDGIGAVFIAVPTEHDGHPYDDALVNVITKLASHKYTRTPLFIIESTLTPIILDTKIIPILNSYLGDSNYYLSVANRRDFFGQPEWNLWTIPRVIGSNSDIATKITKEIIEIVTEKVLVAPDLKTTTLCKALENSLRLVSIACVQELALAYPDISIRTVAKLAASKWNVDLYFPGLKCMSYCLPVAPLYLIMGADKPEKLSILSKASETNDNMPSEVIKAILNRKHKIKSVGILSLSYKADIPVAILSAAIDLCAGLTHAGITVKVNDPYFTPEQIKETTGAGTFDFPHGLNEFDCIIIIADHRHYRATPEGEILKHIKANFILDNVGMWEHIKFPDSVEYKCIGDANWQVPKK